VLVRISRDRVVTIDYTLRLGDGSLVETSVGEEGPLSYLHGRAQIVPGVERAIDGAEEGAVVEVDLSPEEAYGQRDPHGVFVVPRSAFPDDGELQVGMTFSATRSDGQTFLFQVLELRDELVVIDTNHPLAGQALHVAVAVRSVREATDAELRAGKATNGEAAAGTYTDGNGAPQQH
jgi:FKBP-type peptidyl-prolyl cis-trans isomerase SlyD